MHMYVTLKDTLVSHLAFKKNITTFIAKCVELEVMMLGEKQSGTEKMNIAYSLSYVKVTKIHVFSLTIG